MTTPVYKGVTAKLLNGLIYGVRQLFVDGIEKPIRSRLNFVGVTAVDDAENDWVELSLSPVDLSEDLPQPLGTPAAGTTGEAADAGHVHPHGDQGGGSEHELATNATDGFMPATMMAFLEDATAFPTALKLVLRDATGGASFGWIATGGFFADANGVSLGDGVAIDPDANGATWFVGIGATPGNDPTNGAFVWADGAGKLWTLNAAGVPSDIDLGTVYSASFRGRAGVGADGQDIVIGGGDPGTPGTHVPGDTTIELGAPVAAGTSGVLNWRADGATKRRNYWLASISALLDALDATTYVILNAAYRIADGSLNVVASFTSDGMGVGGNPIANQNRTLFVANRLPTAAPTGGAFVGSEGGAIQSWEPNGVRHEIACRDSATGGTSKRILGRMGRATIITGTTTDVEIVPAADLGGTWVARVVVEWGAFDTVDATVAGGIRFATVKGAAGTITVPTSGANQLGGTTDDNTMAAAMSTGASMLVRTSGANLQMRFITLKTDDIRVWARVLSATIVEH